MQSLERELDAAISAAARARAEKRQAEAAQRAAELRTREVTEELENTASMHYPVSTLALAGIAFDYLAFFKKMLSLISGHNYIWQGCLSCTWRSCG